MKKNETLIYTALGLITLGALVYILLPKQENDDNTEDKTSDDKANDEQKTPDKNVESLKDTSGKLTSLIGKDIYTKVTGVNIRNTAEVNNGFVNNIYGEIPSKDILIGKVTSNVKKGDYNWLGVKLSQKAYDIIQSEKSFITRDLTVNIPALKWVREDVIKLK